jgi:phosphopantothenoylcysteine decarboxylase / phosphopantothenate---cysteine ligase
VPPKFSSSTKNTVHRYNKNLCLLTIKQALEITLSEIVNLSQVKNVLLGVTGGIAAYKSADLVRRLKERGFAVRVVMTDAATQFVTPLTMQAVSGNPVHQRLFDLDAEAAMGHIELAKWADVIIVAPATANTIAKIAHGFSDNLLTTLITASAAPLVVAPAMNQQMWANSLTKEHIAQLKQRGVLLIGPAAGEQACGDVGEGRMQEPLEIVEQLIACDLLSLQVANKNANSGLLSGKTLLITAGPTVEPIDPVRFISNHSSGKMGYSLAAAAKAMGAKVILVSGPVNLDCPSGVERICVQTANQMLDQVESYLEECDIFIGCAAVADYTPVEVATQKIKKSQQQMNVQLVKNPDIIAWVAAQSPRPIVVGFAAESQNLKKFAQDKLDRKKLDMICANDISRSELGFNSDENEILVLKSNGDEVQLPANCKSKIAQSILEEIYKGFLQQGNNVKE